MNKREMLDHWDGIPADQPIKVTPVAYKHEGTTYAEDGIRITGSQRFIDSVLSHLKSLLEHENGDTRLQVTYQPSNDRESGTPLGSWNCYIQVHERGGEARAMNAIFGKGRNVCSSLGGKW